MSAEPAIPFHDRPLLVLALGGNALSPPTDAGEDYAPERRIVRATGERLKRLAERGYRLLIVHGNGPQVGRLLRQDPSHGNLDIHIAQTQGELGYLLVRALKHTALSLLTRVVVAEDPGPPVKAVGPVLRSRPDGSAVRAGDGWRVAVASPTPLAVLEEAAIATLLRTHHVIAGGGGGIPESVSGEPVAGVVDKDRIAALLAVALDARHLVFATDVPGVYPEPDVRSGPPLAGIGLDTARTLIDRRIAAAGSMGPKLESALEFATRTGRPASICALDAVEAALSGRAGTRVGQAPEDAPSTPGSAPDA
ncbi:MAG: carbamate kinase [Pseudomonadales bacterium]